MMNAVIIMVRGRSFTMNFLKRIAFAAAFVVALGVLLPTVHAGNDNWATIVTFDKSVQIGSDVFPSGSYMIQRVQNNFSDRIAMVYSFDRSRWEGLIIGVAAHREGLRKQDVIDIEKREGTDPDVLHTWYFKDWSDGIEFPQYGNTVNVAQKGRVESKTKLAQNSK